MSPRLGGGFVVLGDCARRRHAPLHGQPGVRLASMLHVEPAAVTLHASTLG